MDNLLQVLVALLVVTVASAIAIHLLFSRSKAKKAWPANLPPGSLGLPVIGHTLGLARAVYTQNLDPWIRDRIERYGPVSKVSVFGVPIVLLKGPAANKFIFFSSRLRARTPRSIHRIFGEKSILDLHGADHRRIRGALMEFLKPEMLKQYVGRIDAQVRHHLEEGWYGRTTVRVLPLMKRMTFDISSTLLFGLDAGAMRERDALAQDFVLMSAGIYAISVNLPFTKFGRSVRASARARRLLHGILGDKKAKLAQGKASPNSDLFTRLLSLSLRDDDHGEQQLLTDEEIVDNGLFAMLAGHDATSILMTFMVRNLANDPASLAAVVQEHEEIARNKTQGEALTWEDLSKMKFTWQVAQETLRMDPPLLGNLRTALDDIEFDGHCIPKGWQVFWSANLTHMDPSIFPDPAKFDPSRFGSQSSAIPQCSFVAFGGGSRLCPGMDFAKIETLVTMHYLVRQFRWKLCCEENTLLTILSMPSLDRLRIELERKTPI